MPGVDNSKWTSGLDRYKAAHRRCGQVDYSKNGRF
jgi:hypothetical protein